MQNDLTNSEIERRIAEKIHSDRDRRILRLRLIEGWTFERIAEAVEMSPRYLRGVKQTGRGVDPLPVIFMYVFCGKGKFHDQGHSK